MSCGSSTRAGTGGLPHMADSSHMLQWRRWVPVTIVAMGTTLAVTHLLHGGGAQPAQLVLLMLPIFLCAYRGGLVPGLLATLVSVAMSFAVDPAMAELADI